MSVRKRRWIDPKGIEKEAWVAAYTDSQGVRRLKTFQRKKDADAFEANATVQVAEGTHVPDSVSVSVATAAEKWLASCTSAGLERSTIDMYRNHVELHIKPFLGRSLVSKVTVPAVRAFQDTLRGEGRSPSMVKRVTVSLGCILADAQERGLAVRNAVREMGRRKAGKERQSERRQKARLRVGEHIPSPTEIAKILQSVEGRYRPLLVTAVFAGLRSSELRGLRWCDIDLDRKELHVRQRADKYHSAKHKAEDGHNPIGMPKSDAGQRTIPLPPMVVNTLREWKLACPKGELGLAFPNSEGNIEWHANIIKRGLIPAQIAAGVTVDSGKVDTDGNPIPAAKYPGLHALRHFFASWCINLPAHGGLGLPAKVVQERMGHGSIVLTMDCYGHLFPNVNDGDALAAAEQRLLAAANAT